MLTQMIAPKHSDSRHPPDACVWGIVSATVGRAGAELSCIHASGPASCRANWLKCPTRLGEEFRASQAPVRAPHDSSPIHSRQGGTGTRPVRVHLHPETPSAIANGHGTDRLARRSGVPSAALGVPSASPRRPSAAPGGPSAALGDPSAALGAARRPSAAPGGPLGGGVKSPTTRAPAPKVSISATIVFARSALTALALVRHVNLSFMTGR